MSADLLAGNIAAHWVQSGILAGTLLIALKGLRVRDPRSRLAALHLVFIAIFFLPVVQPWRVNVDPPPAPVSTAPAEAGTAPEISAQTASFTTPPIAATFWIVCVVAAGIFARLLWVLYGLLQLRRFRRTSPEIATPAMAEELEGQMGLSARYIRQIDGCGPWTFGVLRPTIALPSRFEALAPEFQQAVICHELQHIRRRDVAIAFAEELASAVLWFHPWIWLLRARIRVAREQVVDADVVELLGNRDEYVRCLVNISGHDLSPHLSQAGAGMLRPSELRARVDAIFQEVSMSRTRFVVAALTFVSVTIATVLVASAVMPLRAQDIPAITADTPRRQINKVYPEYPQDALARGISGTVVVDVTVNAAGDVTTAAVASGPQEFRASAFKAALALKFRQGSATTAMPIAFHYMLTDLSWGVRIGDGLANMGVRPGQTPPGGASTSGLAAGPDATGAYRVGAAIKAPRKITDVAPEYPALARSANVQGVVIAEARIDAQGNVSDTRVLRSIPLLDQAAIEAVKQWKYEPTLMNGIPVPVIMTVTVNFVLRDTIHLQFTLPDGSKSALQLTPDVPGSISTPALGNVRFTAKRSASGDVTLSLYDAANQTHLADVVLRPDDAVVQTPTTPSFGVKLRAWQP